MGESMKLVLLSDTGQILARFDLSPDESAKVLEGVAESNRPEYLTVSQVSKWVNIPEPSLYELLKAKSLPYVRYGEKRGILIKREEVLRWLKERTIEAE